MVMGLGVAVTLVTAITGAPYTISLYISVWISFGFLFLSLISSGVIMTVNGFHLRRWHAVYLLLAYGVYSICNILIALGIL